MVSVTTIPGIDLPSSKYSLTDGLKNPGGTLAVSSPVSSSRRSLWSSPPSAPVSCVSSALGLLVFLPSSELPMYYNNKKYRFFFKIKTVKYCNRDLELNPKTKITIRLFTRHLLTDTRHLNVKLGWRGVNVIHSQPPPIVLDYRFA